ncbi:copper resistance protein Crd2 [Histoplasma capsulatum G186AR]|nr:copper resistance protein Crd2 [Histoplasma capsulatum]QSS73717.1 copper resistance protein Crd2 [Histoplasma capsulatum G186AR]
MTTLPLSCCHASRNGCVCAIQAKCSCGKERALHCNCDKAKIENDTSGARCSCRKRPAGQCTCERAESENHQHFTEACPCGKRTSDSCTCERALDAESFRHETDFTTST